MTTHRVLTVQFTPRSNDGWVTCTCGWTGEYRPVSGFGHGGRGDDTYSEHRRAAGARVAYVSDALRTDASPAFQPPMTKCHRGHEGQWRPRSNGKQECAGCTRKTQADIRQRQREARVA